MRSPVKQKFRKYFKIKLNNKKLFNLCHRVSRTPASMYSYNSGKIMEKPIEACRVAIRRSIRRKVSKIWIRLFLYGWISKKPVGMRMGKGKGNHYKWIALVVRGQILYELNKKRKEKGSKILTYFKAFRKAWRKLPLRHSKLLIIQK